MGLLKPPVSPSFVGRLFLRLGLLNYFHLLKIALFIYLFHFPLLVLKGINHYWMSSFFSPRGRKTKWKTRRASAETEKQNKNEQTGQLLGFANFQPEKKEENNYFAVLAARRRRRRPPVGAALALRERSSWASLRRARARTGAKGRDPWVQRVWLQEHLQEMAPPHPK